MSPTGLGRRKSEMTLGKTLARNNRKAKSEVRPCERRQLCRIVPRELGIFHKLKSRIWPH